MTEIGIDISHHTSDSVGFDDPSEASGTNDFIWNEFRNTRNAIKDTFINFISMT